MRSGSGLRRKRLREAPHSLLRENGHSRSLRAASAIESRNAYHSNSAGDRVQDFVVRAVRSVTPANDSPRNVLGAGTRGPAFSLCPPGKLTTVGACGHSRTARMGCEKPARASPAARCTTRTRRRSICGTCPESRLPSSGGGRFPHPASVCIHRCARKETKLNRQASPLCHTSSSKLLLSYAIPLKSTPGSR